MDTLILELAYYLYKNKTTKTTPSIEKIIAMATVCAITSFSSKIGSSISLLCQDQLDGVRSDCGVSVTVSGGVFRNAGKHHYEHAIRLHQRSDSSTRPPHALLASAPNRRYYLRQYRTLHQSQNLQLDHP